MKRVILIFAILIFLFPVSTYGDDIKRIKDVPEDNIYKEQALSLDTKNIEQFINQLNNETSGYLPSMDFKSFINTFKSGKNFFSFKDIFLGILKYLLRDVLVNAKLLGKLVVLTIICALLQNLEKSFGNDSVSSLAYYSCYIIMIIIIVKSFTLAVDIGKDTIDKMVDFMIALLPTLFTLLTSVGSFTSAAIFDPLIMGITNFVSNVVRNFILPMIFLTAILSIVNNLSESFKVTKLAALLKQICVWTLGFMLTVFIGIITIRSASVQTLDQVTVKTAKFAVDNFIPVVGKCMSDAIATLAGYSLILKDAISTVGLIAIVITCIFPLIKIISMIFIYKVAGALIEPISDKRIVNCLNDISNSLTMIFGSVVCVAVMFFIMIAIIASTGKMVVLS